MNALTYCMEISWFIIAELGLFALIIFSTALAHGEFRKKIRILRKHRKVVGARNIRLARCVNCWKFVVHVTLSRVEFRFCTTRRVANEVLILATNLNVTNLLT